jgi:ABC-type bacteriocin/lantibiotic exporter with double-glycine peptidase domain
MFERIHKRIWTHLRARRRAQLGTVLILTIAASFTEIISIGSVLPFLTVMITPEKILTMPALQTAVEAVGLKTAAELQLPLTILFCSCVVIASATRLVLTWFQARVAAAIGADFSGLVYQRTLYQPYTVHSARNSSEIHAGLGKSQALVSNIIQPTLNLISSSLLLLSVTSFLFWVDPLSASVSIVGMGTIYGCVTWATRDRLRNNGRITAASFTGMSKAAIEGLGGIRDILIDGLQPVFVALFRRSSIPLARAQASNQVLFVTPRFAVESLSIIFIALMAYGLSQSSEGLFGAIPTLGALAIGAQRMLPMVQNIYQAIAVIRGNEQNVLDALNLLEQPMPELPAGPAAAKPLDFRSAIEIRDLSYRYSSSTPMVLKGLNLKLPKGCRVGFIGETGSGKSTLLDILMGLLEPTAGSLLIDGVKIDSYGLRRSWQSHIAHVPQSIFLADDSIGANIAFGVEPRSIDTQRVAQAARRAQIAGTVEGWTAGYDTRIGERGVRLSGGQRQRIGIARALYKQADVLIFDEATSALDNTTEAEVMRAIDALDKDLTILMVAHRLTTLRGCDTIVELKNGTVARIGTYDEIIGAQSMQA